MIIEYKLLRLRQFHNKKSSNKIRTKLSSTSDGRFPWARLQSPRHCVPAGLSARAIPTGVAALRSNQRYLFKVNG